MAGNTKIDTKIFVPTQKSITKVINANIEAMSNITDFALETIVKTAVNNDNIKKVELYLKTFKQLFVGDHNVLTTIINASNNIAEINKIRKIDVLIFKHNVDTIIDCYLYLLESVNNFNLFNLKNTVFESFIFAIANMNKVIFRTNELFRFNLGGLIEIKFKLLKLKFEIQIMLKSFNEMIKDFSKISIDHKALELFKSRILPLIDVMDKISNLIHKINHLKISIFIRRKINRIKNLLWFIVFTFSKLALTVIFSPFISLSILTISKLSFVVSLTSMIFDTLDKMHVGLNTLIKIFVINSALDELLVVFSKLNTISTSLESTSNFNLTDYGKIIIVLLMMTLLMNEIAKIPRKGKMKRKMDSLMLGVEKINEIVKKLHNIKLNQGKSNALKKAAYVLLIVSSLLITFTLISIMSPILILAIPALFLFIGGLYLLRWVISITSKILTESMPKMLLIMLVIGVVISIFTAVSVMFLLLAIVAKPIVLATGWILLMLGSITLVALGIVLIGTIAAMAIPFLLAGILGFSVLSLAVVALTAVATTLKMLQFINLDKKLIEENIEIVLGTANSVLNKLFIEEEKDDRARYEKRWERRDNRKTFGFGIHGLFGKHISSVLNGLTSFAVLITTFLSVGVILLTCMLLKTLQFININNERILTNVATVLMVAKNIMKSIFDDEEINKTEDNTEKPKKKNIFNMISDCIINHIDVSSDVIKLLKTVGSVTYLIMTLASVGIILVISSLLRILQEINLNSERIESNVGLVLNTANKISNNLFNNNNKEPNNTPTKKSWLKNVISLIGKPILGIYDAILSIGFLAISIGSISLIIFLAKQLTSLNDIAISSNVLSRVDSVISIAQNITNSIMNRQDNTPKSNEDKKKTGLLKSLLSGIGKGIEFISSLGWLSTAIISVGLISKLAEHIKIINDLPNVEGIENKTEIVCTTANKIISSVITPTNTDNLNNNEILTLETINSILIGISNEFSTTIDALNSIKNITWEENETKQIKNNIDTIFSSIGIISSNVLNKDFKILKRRNKINNLDILINHINDLLKICKAINEIDTKNLITNADSLIDSIKTINNKINEIETINVSIEKIDGLRSLITYIDNLSLIYKKINEINTSNVKINIDLMINSIENIYSKLINNKSIEININQLNGIQVLINYIGKITLEFEKFANINSEGLERNTNTYIKFVDKVNTMDVKKLETSAKMFEQMSKFSTSIRGDFDRLAEALNENLMPVLEELKEIMEQIPEKLDTGFQNTSASIAATSAPTTRENVEAQARRENPNITPEEVKKVVDSRMSEKAKQDATGMISKLDELISLLKGYGGENVIVQTV